jgi:hypothetical protein
MTSSVQIDEYLSEVPGYLGALPADELPEEIKPGDTLVANYDNASQAGSHWVAMRFPAGEPAQYFDSFGFGPDEDDRVLHRKTRFAAYLRKHSFAGANTPFIFNHIDYQSKHADTCGVWAAWFILGVLEDHAGVDTLLSMAPKKRDDEVKDIFLSELSEPARQAQNH